MSKLVRKSAYLTTLDKHPSAIFQSFSLSGNWIFKGWFMFSFGIHLFIKIQKSKIKTCKREKITGTLSLAVWIDVNPGCHILTQWELSESRDCNQLQPGLLFTNFHKLCDTSFQTIFNNPNMSAKWFGRYSGLSGHVFIWMACCRERGWYVTVYCRWVSSQKKHIYKYK